MSRIYEALEEIKSERQSRQRATRSAPETIKPKLLELENETFRLYRSLDIIFPGLHQKLILFLGIRGGEGVSNVVANLARVASDRHDGHVALLDMDSMNPSQQHLFDLQTGPGWDDVLTGTEPLEAAIYRASDVPLWLLPVSAARSGTDRILDPRKMETLFVALRERFDLVLVDCTPAKYSPDSIALSRKADGVVLVIEAESTRWPVAQTIHQQITDAGGKVLGVVLNKRRYYIPRFIYERL